MNFFMNKECGNIFPYNAQGKQEMLAEAMELFDVGDPMNACDWREYYEVIEL